MKYNTNKIALLNPAYKKERSFKSFVFLFLFFLIWPFGAFVYALINYRRKDSQFIMILFTALFSYSLMADSDGLDLYRILESASKYSNLPLNEVWGVISGLYGNAEDAGVDIYSDVIAFIVTRFTSDGQILLMFYGLIYGWLYVKSLKILLSVSRIKNIYTVIILISFSMIFSMDQIAGVRFATAAYVMFFGLFRYFQTRYLKYIFVASLACLVHFSFIAVFIVFFIYVFFKPRNYILYVIVFFTFILGEMFGSSITSFIDFIGGSLESRAYLYIKQESVKHNMFWYVKYREEMMSIYMLIYVYFVKIRNKKLIENNLHKLLFGFSLSLISLSNITTNISNAGYRYHFVAIMFFMAYVYTLYRYNYKNRTVQILSLLAAPFFLFQTLYALRSILFYTPFTLFFGFSPMVLFMKVEQTVWDVIKSL